MRRSILVSAALLTLGLTAFSPIPAATPPMAHYLDPAPGDPNTTDEPVQDHKIIVYQMMVRLFGNQKTVNKPYGTLQENGVGKFNDITDKALQEIKKLGASHVWYTGVLEHATMTDYSKFGIAVDDADVVKGRAGSPYAVKDYYDVSPDLAVSVPKRMQEFEALVKRTHANGLKVFIDFIPNHVARSYKSDAKPAGVVDLGEKDDKTKAFAPGNNFYYLPGKTFVVPTGADPLGPAAKGPKEDGKYQEMPAKATGNDVFSEAPSINDWYETVKLNYGVDYQNGRKLHLDPIPDTWLKMRDILVFWAQKDVDGFRCDMAEMVPVEFWAWVIPEVKKVKPGILFMGEAYNAKEYRTYLEKGHFDYLYDKVGLYDGLRRLMTGGGKIDDITDVWSRESRGFGSHMLRFLENHDEQRIASKDFAGDTKPAIPAMTVSATLGSGPVMVYFGQEVGEPGRGSEGFSSEDGRTSIFDYWGVPEHQKWMNGGLFDGGKLSLQQKQLRDFYGRLLNLCAGSEALRKGRFYELQDANNLAKEYDDKKLYSFLRFTDKQRMLVVANFSPTQTYVPTLRIPDAAWKLMGLDPLRQQFTYTDVLNGRTGNASPRVTLPPYSAVILEIEPKK
ncbi:alpha amylase C-terminal domain-containing protein [Hymenobacter sp. 15J16-1T3B]|uniref:alpha-amylase family glycosyl hydrolase n=1 Tax=Hymenobacter sp. 15J16-1T3B TaxID=2886941 RepID=UPI001D1303ED|nr:alpha-amylase family glycosyl hydrolase [Hymenobacter sp. 15J16-1T3B]MCC3156160.1 alpha amylase C-terminal domain-containing protein [Hymenobacter sp. 15J16-1T3B]